LAGRIFEKNGKYKTPLKIRWNVEKLSAPYDADDCGRVSCPTEKERK